MAQHYDAVVIGSGQGGNPLAGARNVQEDEAGASSIHHGVPVGTSLQGGSGA